MKIKSQSLRCRDSRAGCNPLSNQQKVRKLEKASVFRTSLIRVNSCDSWALRFFGGAPNASPARTGGALPILIFLSLSLFCTISLAQTPDSVAEREVQRRQAGISQGEAALARGQAAMKAKDYGTAHEEFRMAIIYLPDAVVSGKAHDEAVEGFCKSGVVLAEARIAEGKYADAEAILSEVLSDRYDPKCRPAQELYAHLRQPGYFNKTMSPTFIEKVEQVKQLLTEADGFYQSGRYDLAMKRYDQVLALDPYNTAARKGQEKINNTKYRYGEEAYNETRSRQLWQVQKGWEQPVRRYGQTSEPVTIGAQKDLGGTAQITKKLSTIIIPRVEFRDASLRDAIENLQQQAEANDNAPEGEKGVNIVLPPPPPPVAGAPAASPTVAGSPATAASEATAGPVKGATPIAARLVEPRVSLTLNRIPLGEVLRYIAKQVGLKVKVEPYAVSLVPISEQTNNLITKRYHVPSEFFGGPLDVGYYLESGFGGGQTAAGQGREAQPAPVAEKVIEREQVNYQTATGIGTGAGQA